VREISESYLLIVSSGGGLSGGGDEAEGLGGHSLDEGLLDHFVFDVSGDHGHNCWEVDTNEDRSHVVLASYKKKYISELPKEKGQKREIYRNKKEKER
jgi:hypothetical protein